MTLVCAIKRLDHLFRVSISAVRAAILGEGLCPDRRIDG
jgi:hypothetical protein